MKEAKEASADFQKYFATAGAGKTVVRFNKNAALCAQGDLAESSFYIQKGIKLHVVSEHGKEAVPAVMEAGQFVGGG